MTLLNEIKGALSPFFNMAIELLQYFHVVH